MLALAIRLGVAASALAFAAPLAWAQTPEQRQVCYRTGTADEQTISSCTAVIQGGKESQENLAIAYYNRGIGYQNKKDYQQALRDDQALRLRPNYSSAFTNRGNVFQSLSQYERSIQDTTRRPASRPTTPCPTTIAATPGAGSANRKRPYPTSTRRSG